MIKLAMEAPIDLLDNLPHVTDFDWVLTHLCEESEEYLRHYQKMVTETHREVILDNSVNELGEPLSLDRMDEVVAKLNPTYIVPPDYLNNLEATLGILDDAIKLWGAERIMPVIQGTSLEEVVECGDILKNKYGFKVVSVPYDVMLAHRSKLPDGDSNKATLEELSEGRLLAIKALARANVIFSRVHLLGMNTLSEFPQYTKQETWRGTNTWLAYTVKVTVDTGAPITNAVWNRKFGIDSLVQKGVYFNYYDYNQFLEPDIKETWYWNICVLKGFLNG